MSLQLSPQTWQRLVDRPRERALVGAVCDRLDELDHLGDGCDRGLVAALRFVLVCHQPTSRRRCRACRHQSARRLWRSRRWPCPVWLQVHYELIGPFAGGRHRQQ
ncbi:MAG: hypothetical protein GEV09_28310 [Pseudonocardiaceae bacterium]|nr:hypothetical protein [Pseudonocardiaceae bacterium]